MKKLVYFSILFSSAIGFNGCAKDKSCKPKSPSSEAAQITAYATANGINAQADANGLYYEIIDPGTGAKPNTNSKIVITYTGKLLNGQVFDEQLNPNSSNPWPLTSLIKGWVIGLPLINEGGHIKLIIPSSLAYGCEQYYSIPGNSVLYFDIHLVDVQ